jgi:hypothetical protein
VNFENIKLVSPEFASMAGIKLPDALGEELRSPTNLSISPEAGKVGDAK